MGRILVLVLGLAVVSFVAYYAITHRSAGMDDQGRTPAQTLQNVRDKANQMEKDAQKRADDMYQKTTPTP